MAVKASGELKLYADIGVELGVASTNVSLGTMSNTAGFTDPDSMSEFYGYSPIVTSGLVLYLDAGNTSSYPGSGTTWTDLSGQGNHGTLVNGPTYTATGGGSILFDGVNDYVSTTYTTSTITNITMQVWAYIINTSKKGAICGIGAPTNSSDGYFIGVGNNSFDSAGNHIIGLFSAWRWIDTNYALGTGWVNLTLSLDSSSLPRIYYNGTLILTLAGTNPNPPTTSFKLGAEALSLSRYFNGNIGQIQVYNRQLSDAEILQNFNATKDRYGL